MRVATRSVAELGSLAPGIGVVVEPCPLYANDAKALSARCAHDDPPFQPLVDGRAKLFEPGDLSRDVIRLDIEVNSAFMIHPLNLNADLVRRRFQHHVISAGAGVVGIDRPAERLGPEPRRRFDVLDIAVDQDAVDARTVRHGLTPTRSCPAASTYNRRRRG